MSTTFSTWMGDRQGRSCAMDLRLYSRYCADMALNKWIKQPTNAETVCFSLLAVDPLLVWLCLMMLYVDAAAVSLLIWLSLGERYLLLNWTNCRLPTFNCIIASWHRYSADWDFPRLLQSHPTHPNSFCGCGPPPRRPWWVCPPGDPSSCLYLVLYLLINRVQLRSLWFRSERCHKWTNKFKTYIIF